MVLSPGGERNLVENADSGWRSHRAVETPKDA